MTAPTTQEIRRAAAELVRDVRSMWPALAGNWTRREWNAQARTAGRNYISNTVKFWRANR